MANFGSFNAKDLKKFQNELNKIQPDKIQLFIEKCAKELAARLLAKVIKKTPVGDYPKSSGKLGGTLRRGWTSKTHEEAVSGGNSDATQYANSLEIKQNGNIFSVEIVNPVEYAPYVEYGHRTRNHEGWVEGRFMLTISEDELMQITPQILEKKINNFLKGCFK